MSEQPSAKPCVWVWQHRYGPWQLCQGESQDDQGRRIHRGEKFQRRACKICNFTQQLYVGPVP